MIGSGNNGPPTPQFAEESAGHGRFHLVTWDGFGNRSAVKSGYRSNSRSTADRVDVFKVMRIVVRKAEKQVARMKVWKV